MIKEGMRGMVPETEGIRSVEGINFLIIRGRHIRADTEEWVRIPIGIFGWEYCM